MTQLRTFLIVLRDGANFYVLATDAEDAANQGQNMAVIRNDKLIDVLEHYE